MTLHRRWSDVVLTSCACRVLYLILLSFFLTSPFYYLLRSLKLLYEWQNSVNPDQKPLISVHTVCSSTCPDISCKYRHLINSTTSEILNLLLNNPRSHPTHTTTTHREPSSPLPSPPYPIPTPTAVNWAAAWFNVLYGVCAQRSLRSACLYLISNNPGSHPSPTPTTTPHPNPHPHPLPHSTPSLPRPSSSELQPDLMYFMVCASSEVSDQPAYTLSAWIRQTLIRSRTCRLAVCICPNVHLLAQRFF